MPWENQQGSGVVAGSHRPTQSASQDLSTRLAKQPYAFGISSFTPLPTEQPLIMQRVDEVNAILRMLNDPLTSAVMFTGTP
ncbi:MAG: hypothetical protein J2P37_08190, partial [Ktedonobacteraceae bacterium]|nr:hypothetical protein [Ktedonobacteraceae bacterium]